MLKIYQKKQTKQKSVNYLNWSAKSLNVFKTSCSRLLTTPQMWVVHL